MNRTPEEIAAEVMKPNGKRLLAGRIADAIRAERSHDAAKQPCETCEKWKSCMLEELAETFKLYAALGCDSEEIKKMNKSIMEVMLERIAYLRSRPDASTDEAPFDEEDLEAEYESCQKHKHLGSNGYCACGMPFRRVIRWLQATRHPDARLVEALDKITECGGSAGIYLAREIAKEALERYRTITEKQ